MPVVRRQARKGDKRVLVLGDYRQTITVVRSLSRAGLRVTLGGDQQRGPTSYSRHVDRLWLFDGSNGARFRNQLEAYLRRERPEFVFPVGETPLRRVVSAAQRFEPLATWAMPAAHTVMRCLEKQAMYRTVQHLSIPIEPWVRFSDAAAWRQRALEMGFPVVVKPSDSSVGVQGRKALIYLSAEAFEAGLHELVADPNASCFVLQKFAPGVRHNLHFASADGALVALMEQKVLRTDELDSTGIGIEGVLVPISPQLRSYSERLLARLRYTGIGCIQFLVEETSGRAAFLELNPRMDSTAVLPYRVGFDFPKLAIELAAYRKSPRPMFRPRAVHKPYPVGRKYHWLYGDILAWRDAQQHGTRSAGELAVWAMRSLRVALTSYHLTWELRDPLPTLYMYWKRFPGLLLKRLQLWQPRIKSSAVTR